MRGEDHVAFVRKQQSSFGWDVAPSFPSSGLYGPVRLEAFDAAAVQHVKFAVRRQAGRGWKAAVTVILVRGFCLFDEHSSLDSTTTVHVSWRYLTGHL